MQAPQRSQAPPTARRPLPSWPVDALLWGFPVWWLLGMTPFIVVIMAIVMAAILLVRRDLYVVAGISPWFGFIAWTIPCALMLDSPLRLVGYGQRAANYVAIAIVLLYVVNARQRLSMTRVVGGLTAVWVTVVAGGYLGTFFPEGRLTTPVGLLLPDALTGNEYVFDLVFPPFAEIQHPWGAPEPYIRPSAPFPYANGWGSAMALLTPVALAQMAMTRSTRVKVLLVGCLAAAIVPTLAGLNRGMLLGLGVALAYVAVRLMFRGTMLPFLGLATCGLVAASAAVSLGLIDALRERAQLGSNETRMLIYRETFERTLESPLLGFGAPRPSEVVDLSVGTQGHLWMMMFSFGFVGLGLFLWFLFGSVLRTWRAPGFSRLWLHSSLVAASTLIIFYGIDTMQLLTIALVAAILLRDPVVRAHRTPPVTEPVTFEPHSRVAGV
ncbi:O-antigen ligase like membrane protein [Prauserella halophila]|nr:O-antigen ligase like membrane protein [Prauserella halophila]